MSVPAQVNHAEMPEGSQPSRRIDLETALADALLSGDPAAKERAATQLTTHLRALARSLLKRYRQTVTAEAITVCVQNWWVRALADRQDSRRPGSAAQQYIYCLMMSAASPSGRHRCASVAFVPEPPEQVVCDGESERLQTQDEVTQVMATLSDRLQRRVYMYYFDGKSVHEIATANGCSPNAVRMSLHHARAQLRAALESA